MKAIIFAAGLGTRLHPLTEKKPKALVEVKNTPLLEITINKLKNSGFKHIIVNVHHFADQVIEFLKAKDNFGIEIQVSDERDLLLDTGGGLKKASWFFDDNEPFLIHNVDIISSVDLTALFEIHKSSGCLATMAVKNRKTTRYLIFNEDDILCGWKNLKTGELKMTRSCQKILKPLAYSGIQVVSPEIFKLMPEKQVFSIIDLYLNLAKDHSISAYLHDNTFWMDLGRIENIHNAEDQYKEWNKSKIKT